MSRPTMEDVARLSGTSRSLVSLVFQDSPKVSDASRDRVLQAAEQLGYRPNVLARRLASTRTNTIGVLLDDLHNPFFADVLDAVEDAAEGAGFRVLLAAGRRDPEREAEALRVFTDHRVDGVILAMPRMDESIIKSAAKSVPTVVLGSLVNLPHVDCVVCNEEIAGELVVEHLMELGHRDIVHVGGGHGAGAQRRSDAFVRALLAREPSSESRVIPGDYTEDSGRKAAELLMLQGPMPSAIYCSNDESAAGAHAAVTKAGFTVPHDVSIVGYDNTRLASLDALALTSIEQPLRDMALAAVKLVGERIEKPKRPAVVEHLTPSLIVRTSTSHR